MQQDFMLVDISQQLWCRKTRGIAMNNPCSFLTLKLAATGRPTLYAHLYDVRILAKGIYFCHNALTRQTGEIYQSYGMCFTYNKKN